jgi:hypothetical protein
MSLHLMQVPGWLLSAVESGSAIVEGAVVKDVATRQVLAHLQPTQQLTNLVFEHGLGIATQPLSSLTGVAGNPQLLDLKRMVEQVQVVASIGAAASVLNLGVSIGGFAMVLHSLKRVESKVDVLAATLKDVAAAQRADHLGRCTAALRRADEAFVLTSASERVRYWQGAEKDLADLTDVALHRLSGQGLALEGTSARAMTETARLKLLASPKVLDELRWLLAFTTARAELQLCLGEPGAASQLAARAVDWLAPLPTSAKALAQARMAGQPMAPSQLQGVVRLATPTASLVSAGREPAAARATLARALHDNAVDTAGHMLHLRQDPLPRVLAWLPESAPDRQAAS